MACSDQGSLFDLKKDTTKDIAAVVVSTITETKWLALADDVEAAFKAKRQGARSIPSLQ